MKLFEQIASFVPRLEGWTSVEKAQTFAALIIGYRPMISVELGVWHGRGALSLALAHREIGRGIVYAIDAWSSDASVEGQLNPADVKHWKEIADHEKAYKTVLNNVQALGVQHCIKVIRGKTSEVPVPEGIGFLIIDANHGEAAVADAKRWAPKVVTGGFVYLDDLDWTGGAVKRAEAYLKMAGFKELYPIETGLLLQRL